ncbi:MAG: hypothetical protein IJT30_03380 [Muribaculaceae bacterium]|nr:hypothetical protein [Muribaculaceae bacterium]
MVGEEIINDVVYNLKRLTNWERISFKAVKQKNYDYDLSINGVVFACGVKQQVNKANYNLVVQQMRSLKEQTDKPLMLAAYHFSPELFDRLPEDGISVVESNGNCNIMAAPMFIRISGQKATQPKETKGKAFNEAGLKVIFYLLLDETNINKPYRIIHQDTGLSLGTIKNVIEELRRGQFVLTTEKGRFLKNRKELLDIWQTHYNQSLKPKLLLKEMEFVDADCRRDWVTMVLPDGMCWGGEGGAFLIDHFLVPELFDIYTETPSVKLMMTKKVKFQEKGRIKLYQKFWKGNTEEKTAPKILIYADLMGSGNSRCIESALRLIENGI